MGVIFGDGDDLKSLLSPYLIEKGKDISWDNLHGLYRKASVGNITARDFWLGLGFADEEIDAVQEEYLSIRFSFDSEFIECAKVLRQNYKIALLSNDVAEWGAYLRKIHGMDEYIDYVFISSDLGFRKPGPKIYQVALARLNAKPFECVFIDDRIKNIETAKDLGIASILFNRDGIVYEGEQVRSFSELTDMFRYI